MNVCIIIVPLSNLHVFINDSRVVVNHKQTFFAIFFESRSIHRRPKVYADLPEAVAKHPYYPAFLSLKRLQKIFLDFFNLCLYNKHVCSIVHRAIIDPDQKGAIL